MLPVLLDRLINYIVFLPFVKSFFSTFSRFLFSPYGQLFVSIKKCTFFGKYTRVIFCFVQSNFLVNIL